MIHLELIAETRSTINETDSSNSHFTDAVITGWLNEGINFITTRLNAFPEVERTLVPSVSAMSYVGNIISQIGAQFYNPTTAKWYALDMISTQELIACYPDYLNTEAGEPKFLIKKTASTYELYPKPNTAMLAGSVKITALEYPNPLVSLTDIPNLPVAAHPYIFNYAAFRCFQQLDRQDSATQQISMVTSGIKELKFQITNSGGLHNATINFREFDS